MPPTDPTVPPAPDAGPVAGLVVYGRRRCGVCRRAEAQVRRELRRTAPCRYALGELELAVRLA
ncbi:MAG: hypothetical protein ACO4BW_06615 [Nitriliruptoraceae bacterium]